MDAAFFDDDTAEAIALWMQIERARDLDIVAQRRGGSRPGRAPNVDRRRHLYAQLLDDDFWGAAPVYGAATFQKLFRLPLALFDDVVAAVVAQDASVSMAVQFEVPAARPTGAAVMWCEREVEGAEDILKNEAIFERETGVCNDWHERI